MKHTTLLFSLAALPVASLFAQPYGSSQELTTHFSYSTEADLNSQGVAFRDVSLSFLEAKATVGSFALSGARVTYGVSGEWIAIDGGTSANPLPDNLAGAGIDLGYFVRVDDRRSVIASTTVGRYGTGFNATGVALLQTKSSETFSWAVGAVFDIQGKYPALPIFGLTWQASPDLTVRLGAPRAEVEYRLSPELSASVGVGAIGGTFRTGTVGTSPSGRSLSRSWVDVREIRVGPAVVWSPTREFSLRAELGWVADRRFEFDDRDVTFRTENAAYGGVTATLRF